MGFGIKPLSGSQKGLMKAWCKDTSEFVLRSKMTMPWNKSILMVYKRVTWSFLGIFMSTCIPFQSAPTFFEEKANNFVGTCWSWIGWQNSNTQKQKLYFLNVEWKSCMDLYSRQKLLVRRQTQMNKTFNKVIKLKLFHELRLKTSFLTLKTAADKTMSHQCPFSSGAFNCISGPSEFAKMSWNCRCSNVGFSKHFEDFFIR